MSILLSILKHPANYIVTATSVLITIIVIAAAWDAFSIEATPVAYVLTGAIGTILVVVVQYFSMKEWRSME